MFFGRCALSYCVSPKQVHLLTMWNVKSLKRSFVTYNAGRKSRWGANTSFKLAFMCTSTKTCSSSVTLEAAQSFFTFYCAVEDVPESAIDIGTTEITTFVFLMESLRPWIPLTNQCIHERLSESWHGEYKVCLPLPFC